MNSSVPILKFSLVILSLSLAKDGAVTIHRGNVWAENAQKCFNSFYSAPDWVRLQLWWNSFGEISSDSYKYGILALIGWLYFSDKNYFLEESDYLSGKLPDIISS